MLNSDESSTTRTIRLIRDERTHAIVEWLRGRTGAHGGGFTSADDVADAIEREFRSSEPC